jgi:hypothetical protein
MSESDAQRDQVMHNLTYHPVRDHRQGQMETIRQSAKDLADLIDDIVPNGREKAQAYTDLEDCVQHAIAGVARHGTRWPAGHYPEDEK